jgi:hypothetical protein
LVRFGAERGREREGDEMKLAFAFLFLVGTASAADVSPSEILASVKIIGNGVTCSGTVIAVGPSGGSAYGLSAAHCARVGTEFRLGFVDGSIGSAKWLAADAQKDIALFVCWADDVLAHAPVPDSLPSADPQFVSFPGGSGPKVSRLTYQDDYGTNGTAGRARFAVANGQFSGGSSGAGVFRDGVLTSVVTNGHDGGPAYGCYHNDLVAFVRANADKFRECSPLVKCVDGICAKDANGTWRPSPNVAIVLPKNERQNKDTLTDKAATARILKLEQQVADLATRLANLEAGGKSDAPLPPVEDPKKDPPPAPLPVAVAGKDGAPGRDGRDGKDAVGAPGKDGKSGTVSIVLQWADGKPIASLANLVAGSKVTVPVTKTVSEPKK